MHTSTTGESLMTRFIPTAAVGGTVLFLLCGSVFAYGIELLSLTQALSIARESNRELLAIKTEEGNL